MGKKKIIRITTVGMSLDSLLKGQLNMLSEHYEVVGVCSPGPELKLVSEREGIRTIGVNMERHIALRQDLKSLRALIRLFRKEKPWMVHSITPKAGLLSMIAAKLCGVPVRIHTFTGLIWPTAEGMRRQLLMFTDKITCACATDIIPEGKGVRHDMMAAHITSKPLHVIGNGNVNGIDLTYFDPAKYPAHDASTFTFVFVGRLVADKGINELMEAFNWLHTEHKNVRLLLVGPYEQNLDPLNADTLEIIETNEGVTAVGEQKDVRPYYAQADALVFPSYREGFPNVVLEAGAMGLPCIVTDINGCNEIVFDGINGTIIQPRSEQELYEAMLSYVLHPDHVKVMARQARRLIAERFERSMVWRGLLKRYQDMEKRGKGT